MINKVKSIIDEDLPLISNLSNVAAILKDLEDINWCGFYLVKGDCLYLGPFQGDVACCVIPIGKGVCGTSFKLKKTIIVDNVLEYPNHIACSDESRSEIVVPIILNHNVVGLIDIDSPSFNRFSNNDKIFLEEIANSLSSLFENFIP